jgi:hypothetical protein
MTEATTERRTMRRFDMRLPATVTPTAAPTLEILTETQNVSARGVFFYSDQPLDLGARVDITLTFPPHVTLTDSVRVRFSAQVIRVERSPEIGRIGVAASIDSYEFLRSRELAFDENSTTWSH